MKVSSKINIPVSVLAYHGMDLEQFALNHKHYYICEYHSADIMSIDSLPLTEYVRIPALPVHMLETLNPKEIATVNRNFIRAKASWYVRSPHKDIHITELMRLKSITYSEYKYFGNMLHTTLPSTGYTRLPSTGYNMFHGEDADTQRRLQQFHDFLEVLALTKHQAVTAIGLKRLKDIRS